MLDCSMWLGQRVLKGHLLYIFSDFGPQFIGETFPSPIMLFSYGQGSVSAKFPDKEIRNFAAQLASLATFNATLRQKPTIGKLSFGLVIRAGRGSLYDSGDLAITLSIGPQHKHTMSCDDTLEIVVHHNRLPAVAKPTILCLSGLRSGRGKEEACCAALFGRELFILQE